ncbi:MAG TPA: hypothetical protein VFJ06_02860 [Halococcus sp.]|nr:hypothetical protein [Halococcus sp.]
MPVAQLPGIPGGPEILILVVMALFIVFVFVLLRSLVRVFSGSNDERIEALERRVEKLERERD